MRLVERIARRRDRATRADPVTLEEFGYLLGRRRGSFKTRTGVVMGDDRALGITAWYSGVRYLAETIASMPVHTYRNTGGFGDARRRTQRANPAWLEKPDKELPRFGLVEFVMYSLLHRGNSYNFKLRDAGGVVTGLRPLHPDRVTPGQSSDGTKVFKVKADDRGTELPLTTREVLHIPALSQDGLFGLSPIKAHAESLGIVAATDQYAGTFFGNASHPSGVISVPDQQLSEEEADKLLLEWEKFHKGLLNGLQVGVLSHGGTYNPIALNADDTQLLQSRHFGVTEVCRILRIPPHKLYELERATFSNIEEQSMEAVVDSIRPWVERIEDWVKFDRDLLRVGNFIEFEIEGLLRGDILTRYRSYSIGIQNGFLTRAEPREKENLPFIEGTDELLQPMNMTPGGAVPGDSVPGGGSSGGDK